MSVFDAATRFRSEADPSVLLEQIPFAVFAGITAEVHEGRLVTTMRFDPKLIGNPNLPALHGGSTGGLLEIAAVLELFWQAEARVMPKTIGLTVEYLRSARPVDTLATCVITKQGRRVVRVRAVAWQESEARPVASAQARFLIRPVPE